MYDDRDRIVPMFPAVWEAGRAFGEAMLSLALALPPAERPSQKDVAVAADDVARMLAVHAQDGWDAEIVIEEFLDGASEPRVRLAAEAGALV